MSKNALLIFESPWSDLSSDMNRKTVYPFFEGIEKLNDNLSVYHTVFYNSTSLKAALNDLVTKNFNRIFIYIAAHGTQRMIGNVQMNKFVSILNEKAKECNIEGVLIGSCLVGDSTEFFRTAMIGSSITWMIGYKGEINWLDSTLVDLFILNNMIEMPEQYLTSFDDIFKQFSDALQLFNPSHNIAKAQNGKSLSLKDSVSLVIQPRGMGFHPRCASEYIEDFVNNIYSSAKRLPE